MRAALVVLTGLLVLLTTACGGGGGERLSQEEFQSQANAICAKYQKQLKALGAPSSIDEIPDLVDRALVILNKEIDEVSALSPPEELQGQFDAMLAAADKTKQAAHDLSTAAKAGDAAAVQDALNAGNAASDEADKLSTELGLDACKG
jgi:DNA-binding NtrC family response regulator